MNKVVYTSKLIFIAGTIFFMSGCDFLKEELFTGEIPPLPTECTKEANLLDLGLYGIEMAQTGQLQVNRATNRLDECLQNAGMSEAESKAIIKDRVKTYRERPGADTIKESGDIFVR
jgi:hypothetical protein